MNKKQHAEGYIADGPDEIATKINRHLMANPSQKVVAISESFRKSIYSTEAVVIYEEADRD